MAAENLVEVNGGVTVSNEEVAVLAQSGNEKSVLLLWERVKYFAKKQACRWIAAWEGSGGIVLDDLMQVSFLALLDALESWKPDGGSFIGWYALRLKAAFTVAYGKRTQRDRLDPLQSAASLDAPLDGDDDDLTLGDTIEDPEAMRAMDSVEEIDRLHHLHDIMQEVIETLPEDQRQAIVEKYYRGGKADSKAHNAALRSLRHPSRSRALKEYL